MESAKRVISGTWGELWVDDEKWADVYGLQAKVSFHKEEVALCRQMMTDKKVTSAEGTGSIRLHKVYSRGAVKQAESVLAGRDLRCTLVSKLADPDSYGAERVILKNVSFDDLTLADWEAKALGKVEMPFSFTGFEYVDLIAPQ